MALTIVTLAERPDLEDATYRMAEVVWPAFMLEDPVGNRFWVRLASDFPEYQALLCENDKVLAVANTIPLVWDGTIDSLPRGWDGVIEQGFDNKEQGRSPNALSALSMTVAPDYQRKGLSGKGLRVMKSIAAQHALTSLIAPVRPTLKSSYPLTPIERYVAWTQPDGSLFDPWLRTHARLGAEILKIEPLSMVIPGTVAQWEEWTPLRFPDSGRYVVPGALQPITIDRERDEGRYEEPNVWMRHPVTVMDLPPMRNSG